MLARTREAPPQRMIRPKVPSLVRRSKLLVSPLDAAAIDRAAHSGADAIVLDLGCATSSAQQPAARFAVPQVVRQLAGCGADILAWVDTATAAADVEACALPGLTGLIASVNRPEEVAELDALLTAAERSQGLPQGHFDLELVLGCAQAVLDAEALAHASPRVVALGLDEEGVLADVGVEPSVDVDLLLYARGRVVVAARVAGVQAHGVLLVAGGGSLPERVRRARLQGLRGALCTHPADVPALNDGFSPTVAEVEQARRVREAVEQRCRAATAPRPWPTGRSQTWRRSGTARQCWSGTLRSGQGRRA